MKNLIYSTTVYCSSIIDLQWLTPGDSRSLIISLWILPVPRFTDRFHIYLLYCDSLYDSEKKNTRLHLHHNIVRTFLLAFLLTTSFQLWRWLKTKIIFITKIFNRSRTLVVLWIVPMYIGTSKTTRSQICTFMCLCKSWMSTV